MKTTTESTCKLEQIKSEKEVTFKVYIDGYLFLHCNEKNLHHTLNLAERKNRGEAYITVEEIVTTTKKYILDDTAFMEANNIKPSYLD